MIFLLIFICVMNFGYFYFGAQNSLGFFVFLLTTAMQWALLMLSLRFWDLGVSWKALWALYLFSRIPLLISSPYLEDDYFRYIWDGLVTNTGLNPYLYSPDDPALDLIKMVDRESINFPDLKTIYPPMAQIYFYIIVKFFGESLAGLKIGALFLELFCLKAILYFKKSNTEMTKKIFVLFLFSPLVMKENINSVHFDLWVPALLLFSFGFWEQVSGPLKSHRSLPLRLGLSLLSSIFLAASFWTKLVGILFWPVYWKSGQDKSKSTRLKLFHLISVIAASSEFWLIFAQEHANPFSGLGAFRDRWVFFPSGFRWLLIFFQDSTARKVSGAFFVIAWVGIWLNYLKSKIQIELSVLMSFLLLYFFSPVLNTWYWLWSFPFLVLFILDDPEGKPKFRLCWILVLLWYSQAGYSWFVSQDLYWKLYQPVYGVLVLLAVFKLYKESAEFSK